MSGIDPDRKNRCIQELQPAARLVQNTSVSIPKMKKVAGRHGS